jgi:hypothetical protein
MDEKEKIEAELIVAYLALRHLFAHGLHPTLRNPFAWCREYDPGCL